MKIIEIIGSTLLPEESNFIGFMPLNSYLEKKNVKTGVKCPSEFEELARALILQDALEKLGCTYQNLKKTNKISKVSEDIFSQIDNLNQN